MREILKYLDIIIVFVFEKTAMHCFSYIDTETKTDRSGQLVSYYIVVSIFPPSGKSTEVTNFVKRNFCGFISTDLMRRQEELRRLEELRNQELQKRKQIEMRCAFV